MRYYKYHRGEVREYWILDPYRRCIIIYNFEKGKILRLCGSDKKATIGIYDDRLEIDFQRMNNIIADYLDKQIFYKKKRAIRY